MNKTEQLSNIDIEKEKMESIFKGSFDVKIETFETHKEQALLIYIEGFVDKDLMHRDIIAPLKSSCFTGDPAKSINVTFTNSEVMDDIITDIVKGSLALYYEDTYYIIDVRKFEKRGVEIPEAESVTRGPKEGFNEDLLTNTSLLRRKIRNPNLVIERMNIGRQTNTTVVIAYIDGIVNKTVLKNARANLKSLDTGSVLESGKLEQLMEKKPFSTVSGYGLTQKPDIVASKILEGRVAIFCDGTPHVLTIPELFIENLQTAEDYYHRVLFASFLRVLRLIGLLISVFLPGIAVAIATFNHEMIPTSFLINFIAATEDTPFSEAVEVIFLVIMLELLKESGTRLPKTIGSAVSIVGALIMGDAAVRAGIVSAPAVIVVALTAVCSFIVPNLNEFTTIYRLFFLLLGSMFGIVGIGAGMIIMLTQLSSISSFGIPILDSFSKQELKDSFVRFPLKSLKYRPKSIAQGNVKRSG